MTSESMQKIFDLKLVPLVVLDDATDAVPMAKALVEGGIPVAEVTFRTDAAADVIRAMARTGAGDPGRRRNRPHRSPGSDCCRSRREIHRNAGLPAGCGTLVRGASGGYRIRAPPVPCDIEAATPSDSPSASFSQLRLMAA